ncbi:MAG: hypothetical protein H6594_01505 [Flavobacteriales bacterium]|nr:hypothetical protein [Flavobacteriales bacterium]
MRSSILLTSCLLFPCAMHAQVWLDPDYGTGGISDHAFGPQNDQAVRVLMNPNGSLVIVGSIAVTGGMDFLLGRFNADGSLDMTFGTGGSMTYNIGSQDTPTDAALQDDGKIVVVGYANPGAGRDKVILRFNADGTIDSGFGTGGAVIIDDSFQEDELNGVAIQPDQKIVAVGQGFNGSKDTFYIGRLNSDGTFDSTFAGGTGQYEHTITGDNCKANAVTLMADGRIVSVGTSYTDNTTLNDLVVVRYLADGTLDTTFDADGMAIVSFNDGNDEGTALAVRTDGSVVAGGTGQEMGGTYRISLVGLLPNGGVDATFGTNGTVLLVGAAYGTHCEGLLIDGSGRILVDAVEKPTTSALQNDLFRLLSDGTLDPDLGTGGELVHAVASTDVDLPGMLLQPDGKVVLAGSSGNGGSHDVRSIRYLASPLTGIAEHAAAVLQLLGADADGVTFRLPVEGRVSDLAVYDEAGQLIIRDRSMTGPGGTRHLGFTHALSPGNYVLALVEDGHPFTGRFVVAR